MNNVNYSVSKEHARESRRINVTAFHSVQVRWMTDVGKVVNRGNEMTGAVELVGISSDEQGWFPDTDAAVGIRVKSRVLGLLSSTMSILFMPGSFFNYSWAFCVPHQFFFTSIQCSFLYWFSSLFFLQWAVSCDDVTMLFQTMMKNSSSLSFPYSHVIIFARHYCIWLFK